MLVLCSLFLPAALMQLPPPTPASRPAPLSEATQTVQLGVLLRASDQCADGEVTVDQVLLGSAAERVGVRRGDVIERVADAVVKSDADLRSALRAVRIPSSITLVVRRGSARLSMLTDFTPADRPALPSASSGAMAGDERAATALRRAEAAIRRVHEALTRENLTPEAVATAREDLVRALADVRAAYDTTAESRDPIAQLARVRERAGVLSRQGLAAPEIERTLLQEFPGLRIEHTPTSRPAPASRPTSRP